MIKYFVCHKHRAWIDTDYAQEFYDKKQYTKLHDTREEAEKELRAGFYDDSDYAVYEVIDGSQFERIN